MKTKTKKRKEVAEIEAYSFYSENYEQPTDYKTFKNVLSLFGSIMIDSLISGESIRLQGSLGMMYVKKIKQNPNNLRIDWANSEKDENGNYTKLARFTREWCPFFYWEKNRQRRYSKYFSIFTFVPVRGKCTSPHNAVKKLAKANRNDPFLHLKYYSPQRIDKIIAKSPSTGRIKRSYDSIREIREEGLFNPMTIRAAAENKERISYGYNWEIKYKKSL